MRGRERLRKTIARTDTETQRDVKNHGMQPGDGHITTAVDQDALGKACAPLRLAAGTSGMGGRPGQWASQHCSHRVEGLRVLPPPPPEPRL